MRADSPILLLISRETVLVFLLEYNVSCGIVICGLCYVEIGSLYSNLAERFFFYHNSVLDLVKWPSASVDMIIWFVSFILFMWYIILIDLWILYYSCIPGINCTWSWCMAFLTYCWIWFAHILLRIFPSMFIMVIFLEFSLSLSLFFFL